MDKTVFTGLRVRGDAEVTGSLNVTGALSGPLTGVSLSKADSYSLTASEKTAYIGVTMTAADKTLTLGLAEGQAAIVVNEGGSNAFTLKNVSGDSGTSVAAGKAYLVKASRTANGSKVTLLNDGT